MLKNIGKSIRILAIVLAILSFLGFAALGTFFLLAALESSVSDELRAAGIQAAVISYVLCLLTPFLNLLIYGFGVLISTAQAQAEDSKKTREILQSALSDGLLAEEIARKSGQVQATLLARMATYMSAPPAKKASRAPVQRPVKEAEAPKAPVEEKTDTVQAVKAETEQAPVAEEAPVKGAPAAAPFTDSSSLELSAFLRPLSADEETF